MIERLAPSGPADAPALRRTRDGPGGRFALVLAAAALAATAAAVGVTATSTHAPLPALHATLTVVLSAAFVGTGLLALRLRPYGRFGLLLAAVGFASLLGALHDANGALPYTIGVLTSNVVFAVIVHALLAFPEGRLGSRTSRLLVVAAYVDVLVLQAVAVLVDPLTRWHSDHPRNVALIASHETLATVLEELEAAIAIGIALAVAAILVRRARAATVPARRQLVPVLYGGSCGLLIFAIGLALAPISSSEAVVGIGLGLLASLALPIAFAILIVQGRLSRVAVGDLLVELHEGTGPPDLEGSLRRALGDPALSLGRLRADGRYVDAAGRELALPDPASGRVATPILDHAEPVGILVHDRALRMRRDLLNAVSATAAFALANERALATVGKVEHRNRVLIDAIPDPLLRLSRDGTYLDAWADDDSLLFLPAAEIVGRNICDFLPAHVTDAAFECMDRAFATGTLQSFDYEFEIDGVRHVREARIMPSGRGEVVAMVRDFTKRREAQEELGRLAAEQAALRRVATIAAGDAAPEHVFQAVTEEVCGLLGLLSVLLLRYEDATTGTIVGRFGAPHDDFVLGNTLKLTEGAARTVWRTGAPARVDYEGLGGALAARMRKHGFRSSVAVPISVAGSTWGALIAGLRETETLTAGTEHRLEAFAELVALAVASAQARDELAASRLRIIEAGDAERRRIERNLHDGAQQRLVAVSVGLRLVQAKIATAPGEAEELIAFAAEDLAEALMELRELAQGIHPAVLTERGLEAALEVLAARTPLPVTLAVDLPDRLPTSVEAAVYYVVSESLANIVKHAGARTARVRVERVDGHALVEVADDGAGGADLDGGSGLCGLRDRVETLAGRLDIQSAADRGTRIRAELPVA